MTHPLTIVAKIGVLLILGFSHAYSQSSWETDRPIFNLDEAYPRWPLPHSEKRYGSIDGHKIKQLVVELTNVSLLSKRDGNQLWGRITGTKYDVLTQEWLEQKFRALGLNVRTEEIKMDPQWMPVSWEISIAGAQRQKLASAQPLLRTTASTPPEGVDLEPVWLGLGTQADFIGRNVKGKAALIYAFPMPSPLITTASANGAAKRARDAGAAAVIIIIGIPGNLSTQAFGGLDIPCFSMGFEDGQLLRKSIEQADPASPPKVHIQLDIKKVPGLKTANVVGTLPGTVDENIILIAHLDGYFEAANDNAAGVATMVALAGFYSKLSPAQRRRTMIFVGTAGHHTQPLSVGTKWMHDHWGAEFKKTALLLNCEHTSETQLYLWENPPSLRRSTVMNARMFNVKGSPALEEITARAFKIFGYGVLSAPQSQPAGDIAWVAYDAPSVGISDIPLVYHTDLDRADLIPEPGLEAGGRVIAKIIDEVNRLDLNQLRSPASTAPSPR